MKTIISIIILIILLFLLILLIQSFFIQKETFIDINDINKIKNYKGKVSDIYDTIDDPIEDNLLPNYSNEKEELTEYEVIELFKSILQRPPSIQEIKKYSYFTNDKLKEFLYNSPEYDKLIKTQDNHVNNGIEGAIAKKNLINRIMVIYSSIIKEELPVKMMVPLRDCFIHLQLNEYLFLSMIESYNYKKFEVDVLSTYVLTKKVLLYLFNKHFNVFELKLLAEDKIKRKKDKLFGIKKGVENIKKDLVDIGNSDIINTIKNKFPNAFNEILKSTVSDKKELDTINKTDVDLLNEYLNKNKETYINITSDIKEKLENNNDKVDIDLLKYYMDNKEGFLTLDNKTEKKIDKLPEETELYVRVYEPIVHNKSNLILKGATRPPICTSLGQKQLIQPIFTESKLLFQGTDLNTAFEETQVGSIMPKFIFKEYKDVKIN